MLIEDRNRPEWIKCFQDRIQAAPTNEIVISTISKFGKIYADQKANRKHIMQ